LIFKSIPSTNSSKINSNLLFSKIFSGIVSFLFPIQWIISGGGKIGSMAILKVKIKI